MFEFLIFDFLICWVGGWLLAIGCWPLAFGKTTSNIQLQTQNHKPKTSSAVVVSPDQQLSV
jgi:hypothetical protein